MWVTLVIWIISYLLASESDNLSEGEAAMVATGVAAAAYYTIEPSNPENYFGIGQNGTGGGAGVGTGTSGPMSGAPSLGLGGSGSTGLSSIPGWAVGAVGGAAIATKSSTWLWLAVGAGALLLLSD